MQYKLEKLPLKEGESPCVMVTGGQSKEAKRVGRMIYMSSDTVDHIKNISEGSFSPCVGVLIDFALERLEQEKIKLFGSKN